jgi:hypothetical protein
MLTTLATAASSSSGSSGWLGVDWSALAWVTVTTLVATVVIVTFYSLGLRLLASGSTTGSGDGAVLHRPPIATAGAILCIAIGVAAVLYGIYLVIPLFHS